jgi:hypothetical protein
MMMNFFNILGNMRFSTQKSAPSCQKKKETNSCIDIAVMPWICIREGAGWNIDRGTDYSTEIFSSSHVSLQANAAQCIHYAMRLLFQILQSSAFINYLTIRSCIILISGSQAENFRGRI